MIHKVWNEINYPSPNGDGSIVDVWHIYIDCNHLSLLEFKLIHVCKSGPRYNEAQLYIRIW